MTESLAKIAKKLKAAKAVPPTRQSVEDMILGGMMGSVNKIGAIAGAKDGWSDSAIIEVVPGAKISLKRPVATVIEMDILTLVGELVKVAGIVMPSVMAALERESMQSIAPTVRESLGLEQKYERADVFMAVVKRLLPEQGWKHIDRLKCWRSPAFLYPPQQMTDEFLLGLIRAELEWIASGRKEQPLLSTTEVMMELL